MGTRPDLMTIAKGITSGYIPLGGVMVGDRVAKVLIEQGGDFNHGYTYSGHPVACAVAVANIKLIQQLKLVEHVRDDVGPYLAEQFASLRGHPLGRRNRNLWPDGSDSAGEGQGQGHRLSVSDLEVGMLCRGHCFGNGLIMRAVGDRMIIAPPLVMTRAQIDEMMALDPQAALDLTLADVQRQGLALKHMTCRNAPAAHRWLPPMLRWSGRHLDLFVVGAPAGLPSPRFRLPAAFSPSACISGGLSHHEVQLCAFGSFAGLRRRCLLAAGGARPLPRRRKRSSISTTGPTTSPKTRSGTSRRRPGSRSATTISTTTKSSTPSWWLARLATTSWCLRRTGPSCNWKVACCASWTKPSCPT